MRRLFAILLSVGFLSATLGCGNCVHGVCDCCGILGADTCGAHGIVVNDAPVVKPEPARLTPKPNL